MDELEPSHIKLGGGGAAPLTGLQEDDPNRKIAGAHILKEGYKFSLGEGEAERDFAFAGEFRKDAGESESPEWEIVSAPDPCEGFDDGGEGFVIVVFGEFFNRKIKIYSFLSFNLSYKRDFCNINPINLFRSLRSSGNEGVDIVGRVCQN